MTTSDHPEKTSEELDFTRKAFDTFYDAVDDPYFRDRDLDVIYETLKEKIRMISFGDFLKRYIYEKAEMTGNYGEIPVTVYRDIICSEFAERQTPVSFQPTTARLKNLAKNWLEQKTVNRSVVLLLGFGLGMSADDVNDFLTKALKEQRLNAKDPLEVISWYCYSRQLGFRTFERLWLRYTQQGAEPVRPPLALDATSDFKTRMLSIRDEEQLTDYLSRLPIKPGTTRQSVMARKQFDRLYEETCDWVAEVLTEIERNDADIGRERLQDRLNRSDRYYDCEKKQMLKKAETGGHTYRREEIRAANVEQVAFASIPKDSNGNLLPLKASALGDRFSGTRLSRQHLGEILDGKGQITRYDLITLSFLAFSQRAEAFPSALKRYSAFIERTNEILEKSDMGPIYPVNPYESFLMMCALSEDPAGTFADVWELSYTEGRTRDTD